MKHTILPLFCLILLFSPCKSSGALELEVLGGLNFMTYHPDRDVEGPHSQSVYRPKFQEYPFPIGKISLRGDISESMSFDVSLIRDNILLNNLSFTLYNRTDNFRFEFGPFIGMGDKLETPSIGIIGSIEITFPGIAFLSFGGSSTLGSSLDFTSASFRESAEAKVGFWLPNLIPSFTVSTRSLKRYPENWMELRDTLTRYQLSLDIFFKNIPFTLRVDAGYETYTRTYKSGNQEPFDTLNAWYAGVDMSYQVTKPLKITTNIELPLFPTANESMLVPDFWNIFKATVGVVYTFF